MKEYHLTDEFYCNCCGQWLNENLAVDDNFDLCLYCLEDYESMYDFDEDDREDY